MPSRIGPASILTQKDFRRAARTGLSLSVGFCFEDIETIDDGNVAVGLNLDARELQPDQASSAGGELAGSSQDGVAVFPGFLSIVDSERVSGEQLVEGFLIIGKSGAPDLLARRQQFLALAGR
jgi:hypothetical protein